MTKCFSLTSTRFLYFGLLDPKGSSDINGWSLVYIDDVCFKLNENF